MSLQVDDIVQVNECVADLLLEFVSARHGVNVAGLGQHIKKNRSGV